MNPPLESAAPPHSNQKARPARPFLTSYWFEFDRILCGDHPFAVPGLEEQDAVSGLLRAGFRVFVDFSAEGEMPSYSQLTLKVATDLGIDPAGISFHRLPILRGGSPHNSNRLRAILQTIRLARVREEKVYLHCANGHGRTGTIAGCLYREIFKFASIAALGQLNTSFGDYGNPDGREFGAALRFGETPETPGQRDFVLNWYSHQSISQREVSGGILGAAAAEIFALTAPLPPAMSAFHESMILDMIAGLYRPGRYEHTWTENPLDPSPLQNGLARRKDIPEEPLPPEEDNVSCLLPCLLPFALARYNFADLIDRVIAAVSLVPDLDLTDDRSRYCAVYYCLVVGDLIHGSTVPMAAQFARDAMAGRPESSLAGPTVLEMLDPDSLFDRTENEMTSPGNFTEILAAALWSVHHGEDYRAAVLQSLCLGGESGTLASLVGGLAGIIHGEAAIPQDWRPGPGSSDYLRHRSEAFRSFLGEESCLRIAQLPE